jgi:acyl-CoA thioesterase I
MARERKATLTASLASCCFPELAAAFKSMTILPPKFRQFPSWISSLGFVAGLFAMAVPAQTAGTDLATASAPSKSILVLGDSLAAGYGLDPSEAFPAMLQKKIEAAGLNFTVVNAGVSGETSSGGLRRLDWSLKRRVDVLLLELGGNDGLRGIPVAVTRTNLQAIIDRTRQKYPHAEVVLAGMQMPPNMGHEYTGSFARIFPELAKANQAALIPFLLEGVGGRPELNLPDRIHPTAAGHEIVADNAWKVLKPVLARMTLAKP